MVIVPGGVRCQEHGHVWHRGHRERPDGLLRRRRQNNDVATGRLSPLPHYQLHHQFIIIMLQPQRTCHRHCMRVRA